MKRLKKGLVGLMVLALLVAYIPVKTLLAEEIIPAVSDVVTDTVVVSDASGKTGEEVTVTLSFTDGVKVKALSISDLQYDKTKLQLVDGEWNIEGKLSDWGKYNEGEGVIAFEDNNEVVGTFFTFTFKIIEETTDGDAAITCKVGAKEKQSDGTEKDIELTVAEGKVTIETIKKQIVVGSGKGYTGKQISVPISLENNPGIVSMLLSVNYDTSVLELASVTDGEKLGEAIHSDAINVVPYTLCWMNSTATENFTYSGEIVVLTFNVLENAELGDTVIEVSYDYANDDILDYEMNPVKFLISNGTYTISDVLIGDVNSDGKVNMKDGMELQRYIARWSGYTADTINLDAADVNADGKVNMKDGMVLQRYIARWSGYSELPYTE